MNFTHAFYAIDALMSYRASCRGRRGRVIVWVGLVVVGFCAPLHAAELTNSEDEVQVAVGQVLFLHSRSLAYSHLFRLGGGLQWLRPINRQWAWGAGIDATFTRDDNYQIASAQIRGRRQWEWLGGRVSVGAGLGVGRNPPILSADLQANAAVAAVVSLAADARWPVAPGLSMGVAATSQLFATAQLRAFAAVAF